MSPIRKHKLFVFLLTSCHCVFSCSSCTQQPRLLRSGSWVAGSDCLCLPQELPLVTLVPWKKPSGRPHVPFPGACFLWQLLFGKYFQISFPFIIYFDSIMLEAGPSTLSNHLASARTTGMHHHSSSNFISQPWIRSDIDVFFPSTYCLPPPPFFTTLLVFP